MLLRRDVNKSKHNDDGQTHTNDKYHFFLFNFNFHFASDSFQTHLTARMADALSFIPGWRRYAFARHVITLSSYIFETVCGTDIKIHRLQDCRVVARHYLEQRRYRTSLPAIKYRWQCV